MRPSSDAAVSCTSAPMRTASASRPGLRLHLAVALGVGEHGQQPA